MSVASDIEHKFVETVAIAVLHAGFNTDTEWRKGWLDGYGRAYTQMTGKSHYQLIRAVNEMIEGSGKKLTRD